MKYIFSITLALFACAAFASDVTNGIVYIMDGGRTWIPEEHPEIAPPEYLDTAEKHKQERKTTPRPSQRVGYSPPRFMPARRADKAIRPAQTGQIVQSLCLDRKLALKLHEFPQIIPH